MKTSNPNGDSAQGADAQTLPTPSVAQVEKWLTDDIGRVRKLIETIHNNPDLLRLIAERLQGEIENHKNREALKNVN